MKRAPLPSQRICQNWALSAVAGAVSRDCRRGCGARGRRWGPGSLRSGQRSVQRLQKGLRRAWSLLGAWLSCPHTSSLSRGPFALWIRQYLTALKGARLKNKQTDSHREVKTAETRLSRRHHCPIAIEYIVELRPSALAIAPQKLVNRKPFKASS